MTEQDEIDALGEQLLAQGKFLALNPEGEWMTSEDVTAELVSLSRKTLRNQRNELRGLPPYRFDGRVYYELRAIVKYRREGHRRPARFQTDDV